jgi:hypothetical protein
MIPRSLIPILIVLILSTLCLAENDSTFSLRLEGSEGRKVLLDLPVNPGDQFYIYSIHSSDKTPIWDTFRIDEEGRIILIEEAFLWHGAGLEFQNHKDVQLVYGEKWIKVRLNRPLPALTIRVGRVAQQVFFFRDQSIRLDGLVKPGEGIIFFIAR